MLHEFTMAKLEMQDELRKTKTVAISFAIGAGVAVVGGLLLILMLVHLLAAFTTLPYDSTVFSLLNSLGVSACFRNKR